MKRLVLILAATALSHSALAADLMPLKAPPKATILQSYSGSGTYFGIGTFAEADKSVVQGAAGTSLSSYTAGGAVAGVAAYMWGDGTSWKALEVSVAYQNIGGTSPIGAAPGDISSKIGFTERFLIGGPLAQVLSILPNLSTVFPVLPGLQPGTVGTTHPYLFLAAHQDQVGADYMLASNKVWNLRAGAGVGVKSVLGNAQNNPAASPVTLDIWAEYLIPGAGMTIGGPVMNAHANQGGGARIGTTLEY